MKLLLDQGLPRSTVQRLAGMGIAAEHVGNLGMARAADAQILDVARERQAVVVTLDADFHALLATSHATGSSVVRIRIEGLNGERLAAILSQVLAVASTELEAGAVVSVTARRIRVRLLPIDQSRSSPQ
jgi:predicted nuclease of predicted toxin-antitoxin system